MRNGAVPKAQVVSHICDEIALARERVGALSDALDQAVALYQHDQADDEPQRQNIERLQRQRDTARRHLDALLAKARAVEQTGRIPDISFAEVT